MNQDQIMSMKVSDLKKKLLELGLSSLGVKATLQKRLLEAVQSQPAASAGMDVEEDGDFTNDNNEGVIDESIRYKGTVFKYEYRRGFGLITPEGGEEKDRKNKIYVHWKQIQSADSWPALTKGMEVEYYLGERNKLKMGKDKKLKKVGTSKFAGKVTLTGGAPVTITQDELKKSFPDRSQRFQGTVKFFHARKGYGFIKPNIDFSFNEQDFKAGEPCIYVAREDIKTSEETAPSLKDDLEVEFTLYKREKAKQMGAGDVTLPGGGDVTAEHFGEMGPKMRRFNNNGGGYGPNKKGRKGGFKPFKMTKQMKKQMKAMMGGGGGNMMMMPMGGMGGGMNMMGGGNMMMMPMGGGMQNMMQMPMMMGGGGMPMMMMMGGQGKKKWNKKKGKKNKGTW